MGRQAVRDGGRFAFYDHSADSRPRVRAVPLCTLAVEERELGMKGMKIVAGTGIDFGTHTWTIQSLRKGASGVRASSGCRHGLFGHGLLAQTMDSEPSLQFTPRS